MQKQWKLIASPPEDKIDELCQILNVNPLVSTLLLQREIGNFEDAKSFFRPSLNDLHDPFLMADMDKAVSRIQDAIEEGQKILIYGDYDVDGTTSVALMFSFLREIVSEELLHFYIPDRYAEGYGISMQGVDFAHENNCQLIIALDCGITAHAQVDYATSKGIDFIICDHHLPKETLPKAIAVLDHKRSDCHYPYKELTGCGIGFKLVQALSSKLGIPFENIHPLLDLVAISTCCDIVPLTGENRVLVHFGMLILNDNPRTGLRSFVELSGKKGRFNVTDLVFTIGPRINAAGRIEHGKRAVELLLANTELESAGWTHILEANNTDRKELDQQTSIEALGLVEELGIQNKMSTVLFQPHWHKGVIGIVASRLIEQYYRPTIMLTESKGKAVGSARSIKGFDIHEAIGKCDDLLEQYGGHQYAAGLTMPLENVDQFVQKFEAVVRQTIDKSLLIPSLDVNVEIDLDEINPKFWNLIKQFAPFGPENMKPVFMTRNVKDAQWSKKVGDGTHLKLDVMQDKNPNIRMGGIAFGFGELESRIKSKESFDIAYTIEENVWQEQISLQLMIKDIRFNPS